MSWKKVLRRRPAGSPLRWLQDLDMGIVQEGSEESFSLDDLVTEGDVCGALQRLVASKKEGAALNARNASERRRANVQVRTSSSLAANYARCLGLVSSASDFGRGVLRSPAEDVDCLDWFLVKDEAGNTRRQCSFSFVEETPGRHSTWWTVSGPSPRLLFSGPVCLLPFRRCWRRRRSRQWSECWRERGVREERRAKYRWGGLRASLERGRVPLLALFTQWTSTQYLSVLDFRWTSVFLLWSVADARLAQVRHCGSP